MKILVADDSPTNLALISSSLENLHHEVMTATSGQEAIILFQKQRPDLIILDVVMEGMNGFECAAQIRSLEVKDWIPIIFLSASVDNESIAKGIDAGGDDYLTKPFSDITLAAKIKAMQRISDMREDLCNATQKLTALTITDSLTGINNRFHFNQTVVERINQAKEKEQGLVIFFVDLDKFKIINDTLGHQTGDLLLQEMSIRLKSCLRKNDFLARMGGDEFAFILDDIKSTSTSEAVAKKIVSSMSNPLLLDGHKIQCSVSIGIACYPKDGLTAEELLKNADTAMYHAKKYGRNNYKFYTKLSHIGDTDPPQDKSRQLIEQETMIGSTDKLSKLMVIHCLVNQTHVCINLDYIKKSLALPQLEPIPQSAPYIVGVMNLAGRSLPVMDLGMRLNIMRNKPYTLDTPILICSNGQQELGLVVDKIFGFDEVMPSALQFNSDSDSTHSSFVATLMINGKVSFLINMNDIFSSKVTASPDQLF